RTAQIVSSFFTSATALSGLWPSGWGTSTAGYLGLGARLGARRSVSPVDQRGPGKHEHEGEADEAQWGESLARGDGGGSGRARQDVGGHEKPGGGEAGGHVIAGLAMHGVGVELLPRGPVGREEHRLGLRGVAEVNGPTGVVQLL